MHSPPGAQGDAVLMARPLAPPRRVSRGHQGLQGEEAQGGRARVVVPKKKSLTQIPVDFEQCLLPSSDRGSPMASAAPHVFRPATPQNHPQPHPLMQFPASGHRSRPSGCLAVDFDLLWIRPYAPQRLLLPPRLSSASKVIFYSRLPGGGAQRGWREPGPFCFAN